MILKEMVKIFKDTHATDGLAFAGVEPKFSQRKDLHAFILLDKLLPGNDDIISASEHDEYFLNIDPEELAAVVTEQVIELMLCGVLYSRDGLFLFA